MRVALLLLIAGLASSGCLVPEGPLEVDTLTASFEPSMLPNFGTEAGPAYRFLQIHQHVFASPAEEREWNNPGRARVVCYRLDGLAPATMLGDSAEPAADMAAAKMCWPTLDAGRGRLYTNRTAFLEQSPMGVAVTDSCSGDVIAIRAQDPGIVVAAPGRSFRAEFLANDTLLVDRTWYLEPGRTLKLDYYAAGPKPGRDDDKPVKLVFDYAGFWLVENVGEFRPDEGELPPRPLEGNGPQAWVPREPKDLEDLLAPLMTATPASSDRLVALRVSALGGRVTDLRVRLQGEESVEWFVAGGNETHLKMLGLVGAASAAPTVRYASFEKAFAALDLEPHLRQTTPGQLVEIQWQPAIAFESHMPIAWSETWLPPRTPCNTGCSYVWAATPTEPATWRAIENPSTVRDDDALTLTVSELRDGEMLTRATYHRPAQ